MVEDLVAENRRAIVPDSSDAIASRIVDGNRFASDSYALPASGAGSETSLSIPWRPAAMTAANARVRIDVTARARV
jgi:hypothetical protein